MIMQIDSDQLAIMLRVIRTSLLFDENWYKTTYHIKGLDGALHYLLNGVRLDYDPSPFFLLRSI